MKILQQIRTNINYMPLLSDCLIEICNTHTITFGYQIHFFSQITFKLHLAWKVFDCLLWVKGLGVMMVNIRTRGASVNIAFSSSRNAALIEREMLQNTSLSMKNHHCTLSEMKNLNFYNVRPPCLCLSALRGSKTTLKPGLFYKIYW